MYIYTERDFLLHSELFRNTSATFSQVKIKTVITFDVSVFPTVYAHAKIITQYTAIYMSH